MERKIPMKSPEQLAKEKALFQRWQKFTHNRDTYMKKQFEMRVSFLEDFTYFEAGYPEPSMESITQGIATVCSKT